MFTTTPCPWVPHPPFWNISRDGDSTTPPGSHYLHKITPKASTNSLQAREKHPEKSYSPLVTNIYRLQLMWRTTGYNLYWKVTLPAHKYSQSSLFQPTNNIPVLYTSPSKPLSHYSNVPNETSPCPNTGNNNSFSSPTASVVYKPHIDYMLKQPAVQQSPCPVQLRAAHLNLGSASISDLMVCTTERSSIFSTWFWCLIKYTIGLGKLTSLDSCRWNEN